MTFQILSLSGGGYLGLYTATVLAELEQEAGKPLGQCFDLLAGTSVGGIIALGLAAGTPAENIRNAFEANGTSIFSERPAPHGRIQELIDFSRSFFKPKYGDEALRDVVEEIVGEMLIGDLKHRVIVPTVNLTKGSPQLFKTPHHPSFIRDHKIKVVDVALAASAAPTYFPVAEIGNERFADGGLFANSPDFLALHEAEKFLGADINQVKLLSIGTTTTEFSMSHASSRHMGLFNWRQRLIQVVLSSQQMDVGFMAAHRLGDRYLRIDKKQSKDQERDLGLDVATTDASKTIKGLAEGSVQDVLPTLRLKSLLANDAPRPTFYYGKHAVQQEA